MPIPLNPEKLRQSIRHKDELIQSHTRQAEAIVGSDPGSCGLRKWHIGMARNEQKNKGELEAQLRGEQK